MVDVVANIAVSVIVGIASAMAATFFAFRKFRAEKIWEIRAVSYQRLIEALHEMKRVRRAELEALESGGDIKEEYRKQLWDESRDAKRNILKIADSAEFILSEDISKYVNRFSADLDAALGNTHNFHEMLSDEDAAISAFLSQVKKVGKKELGL